MGSMASPSWPVAFQLSCSYSRLDNEGAPEAAVLELLGSPGPQGGGIQQLQINSAASGQPLLQCSAASVQVWQGLPNALFIRCRQQDTDACICLRSTEQGISQALQLLSQQVAVPVSSSTQQGNGTASENGQSKWERKTDQGSAEQYFAYYSHLQHQQNMLQDYVRTGMYSAAITQNSADFRGKVVMDVGAGSGILSLFAAQAGARKVYAVEASGMAKFARQLANGNPGLGAVIEVVHSKIEDLQLPEKVDVLVSEPMGTLLVNERMLETYIHARDHFLKPGGKMFPQIGRIHCAAFSDEVLHAEVASKAGFWMQNNFYGIDVSPLYTPALESYFAQVVVDALDPSLLVSSCATHILDFGTCTEQQLHDFTIPLHLQVAPPGPCMVHGVATWFDVLFPGSNQMLWLSTAPGLPTTHWFQLRCVLAQPILVAGPTTLTGQLHLVAHRRQSYDVHLTLQGPPTTPGGPPQISRGTFDLKEPYYRQLNTGWWPNTQQQQQQQPQQAGGFMQALQ